MPIEFHPYHIPLNDNAIIWRYMSRKKYFSLLETSALFFCRADKFSDPFEGSIPRKEAEFRIKEQKNVSNYLGNTFNEDNAKRNITAMAELHKNFKRGVVINCWHINELESDAMWRLYLKNNEGVAIQTTVKKLKLSLQTSFEIIELSKIRYLDYENDIWYHENDYPYKNYNYIIPYIHKRKEFIHENELRLYHQIEDAIWKDNYWDTQPHHIGKLIKIDMAGLIDKIYLPPTINNKAHDEIIQLSKDLGYNFEFIVSKLESEPYF